jgi:hypothetical protein
MLIAVRLSANQAFSGRSRYYLAGSGANSSAEMEDGTIGWAIGFIPSPGECHRHDEDLRRARPPPLCAMGPAFAGMT